MEHFLTYKDIKRLAEITKELDGIYNKGGLCGINSYDDSVQLNETEFKRHFEEYERLEFNRHQNELVTKFNGIKFIALEGRTDTK